MNPGPAGEAQTMTKDQPQVRTGGRSALALFGFLAACFLAAALGAFSPPGEWYQQLNKPAWNPPAWVFGPVWTFLYASMAVAAWDVWRRPNRGRALSWFWGHLLLNAAWSPIFFGLRRPGLAFAVIVLLALAVAATCRAFFKVSRSAGAAFVPYLAWVCFAAVLNGTLWRLNP
jgi:tryptophan-rich sensory protein